MMGRRVVAVLLAAFLVLVAFGLVVTWLQKQRDAADRAAAQNSLRQLGQFAADYTDAKAKRGNLPAVNSVPPGTVVRPELPPDRRLSWVVQMLPLFDQKRQDTTGLLAAMDLTKPWDAYPNREAGRTPLGLLLCPANPPAVQPDEPAVTQFVGIAGAGPDAAALPPDSPRAGSFRYDSATPLSAFPDGLSRTLLFAETNRDLGPWAQGGPATLRGVLDSERVIGVGGQFGGNHVGGAFFGFADGHVEFLGERMRPAVLAVLATRAGGTAESERLAD